VETQYQTKQTRKVVLTGGPGIGKTTVLNVLNRCMGYQIIPEAARMVIEEQQAKNSDCLPWKNLEKFNNELVTTQLSLEKKVGDELAFLDRGLVDNDAYCTLGNVKTHKEIVRNGRGRYEAVFILDPLSTYQNDSARTESREEALRVHKAIYDSYKKYGYSPVRVPVMKPKDRAEFILRHLEGGERQ
jgi:predicted ATPase